MWSDTNKNHLNKKLTQFVLMIVFLTYLVPVTLFTHECLHIQSTLSSPVVFLKYVLT